MRRLVLVPAGLLAGFAAAVVLLTAGLLAEALQAPAGASLALARVATLATEMAGPGGDAARFVAGAVWRALLWTCLAPLCLVAVVAEAARLRSLPWLAGGTGALAASAPAVLRALASTAPDIRVSALEARLTLLLLVSGAAGGAVFWLFAGRGGRLGRQSTCNPPRNA